MRKCKNCKWWTSLQYTSNGKKVFDKDGNQQGWCQRNSPSDLNKNKWPEVCETYSCGEWRNPQCGHTEDCMFLFYYNMYEKTGIENTNLRRQRTLLKKKVKKLETEILEFKNKIKATDGTQVQKI